MKNKYLLVIIVALFSFCIRVSAKTNYFGAIEQVNNYIKNYSGYDRYIVTQNVNYGFENGNIVANDSFTNGGLLNKDEFVYSKNEYGETYLNNGLEYFTMTNVDSGSVYVVKPDEDNYLTGKTMTQKSSIRVANYIQSDVNVSGSGSKNDPWVFVDKYYVRLDYDDTRLNVTPSTFVVPGDGAIVSTVTTKSNSIYGGNDCDAAYNTSTNKLVLTNIRRDVVCTLYSYPSSFIITYNSNGGNNCNPTYKSVVPGNEIGPMCEPSRSGYSFIGWFDEAENGVQIGTDIILEQDMEVFAHWNQNDYVITYNSNGGDACDPSYKTVVPGYTVGAMCSPERSGYGFLGWFTAAEGGSQITSDMIISQDMEVFAHWNPNNLTVTYNCNGGSGVAPASANVIYGQNANISSKPCGYKIVAGSGTGTSATPNVYYQTGWSTSSNGTAAESVTVTEDTRLFATWGKLFTYNASYEVVNDGSGNWTVKYLTSGSLVMNQSAMVDAYVVGGGGGGGGAGLKDGNGSFAGAGGGGGGAAHMVSNFTLSGTQALTIGAGGAGAANQNSNGGAGGTSSLGTLITASGGSGGSKCGSVSAHASGGAGGSTVGGSLSGTKYDGKTGGAGASNGTGYNNVKYKGQNGTNGTAAFGVGSTYYGASGGGGAHSWSNGNTAAASSGGSTGGGTGATTINSNGYANHGTSAADNTGAGGGGAAGGGCVERAPYNAPNCGTGGNGGSGIIIIRNHR